MTDPSLDLKAALADVRRAYRLVYAYQRRLADLLLEVSAALAAEGFAFHEWRPSLYGVPAKSGAEFFAADRWAWDLLPGYAPSCEWRAADATRGARRVVLVARADTGFVKKRAEPDPADFRPVEESRSALWIGLWRSPGASVDWDAAWKAVSALASPHDGQAHTVTVGGAAITYRNWSVELADLPDTTAVRAKLLDPLVAWVRGT